MAINISTDINVTTGGKLTDIGQIQGGWRTVDNESDMYALTASAASKQKLQNGMMFYVSASNSLYTLDIAGAFPIVTYNFNSFTWPGSVGGGSTDTGSLLTTASVSNNDITFTKGNGDTFTITVDTGSVTSSADLSGLNSFTASADAEITALMAVTGSYAVTGSNTFTDNQTIDGLLILTTQSVQPTFISGGLYLDSEYNLYLGSA